MAKSSEQHPHESGPSNDTSGINDTIRYDLICSPKFESIETKVDKVIVLLQGNGKPGLIVRLDRVERIAAAIGWVGGLAITVLIGLIITAAWQLGGRLVHHLDQPAAQVQTAPAQSSAHP